jgi:transposase InsO family protein
MHRADYLKALAGVGLERSTGRTGSWHDSAMKESLFSSSRIETILEEPIPATRPQAELAVFNQIEIFSIPCDATAHCGQISLVAFENRQN